MDTHLVEKINILKQQRNAVILAHNYQLGQIQDIADFVGDSLGLSRKAAETDADVILFCGVLFMAETAAILSPQKTVLMPDKHAGCPMADMITAEQLQKLKDKYPDALVVCYVNSTAEVKALSDYCCTSANAIELVNSLPVDKQIIFVPDKYLGQFVRDNTNRDIILWPGYCSTHVLITAEDIENARAELPGAIVMAHPECTEPVKASADQILSTSQMIKYAKDSDINNFIIATETGIIHSLKKQNPGKTFIPAAPKAVCPNMKRINLEKVAWSLEDMQYKITVPEDVRLKAKIALDKMLEVLPVK